MSCNTRGIRKDIFTMRAVKQSNKLPSESVKFSAFYFIILLNKRIHGLGMWDAKVCGMITPGSETQVSLII